MKSSHEMTTCKKLRATTRRAWPGYSVSANFPGMPYGKTRVRQRLTAVSKGCWRYGTPKLPLIKASCPTDWQRKRMLKRTSRGSDATLLTSQLAKGRAPMPFGTKGLRHSSAHEGLGLRGAEIVELCLEDIDWRAGILVVCDERLGVNIKLQ